MSAPAADNGARSGSAGTQSDGNNTTTMNATARRKRGMSRFDLAATYAKTPARVKTLAKAQDRAAGRTGSGDSSAPDGTNGNGERMPLAAAGGDGGGGAAYGMTWFQSIHKLHLVTSVFAVLGFIMGIVSFTTDYWFVSRLGTADERHNGLFTECYSDTRGCIDVDFTNLYWSVDCHIDGGDIRWTYYVIRGFIFTSIVACVVSAVLIGVSTHFYLTPGMSKHSFSILFFMAVPILCWAVAIGRFAHWQADQLYCGKSFCDTKFATTDITDCEEGYGYSFSLAVLCFVFHIFGAGFAIARHCFGEWVLEDAEGEDLAETTTRVNVENTLKDAKKSGRKRAATIVPIVRNEARAQAARARGSSTISSVGGGIGAGHEPYNGTASGNAAAAEFAAALAAVRDSSAGESYEANDWVRDEDNPTLEWSDQLAMYRDRDSGHLYNPATDLWYDFDTQEWYSGD